MKLKTILLEAIENPMLKELEQRLKSHDWWYEFSDDHRYWKRGGQEMDAIRKLVAKINDAGLQKQGEAIWKKTAPADFKTWYPKKLTKSVNEGMISPKMANSFKIGNQIKTEKGTYTITGFGSKTGATRDFEAENEKGEKFNLRVSLRGATGIQVAVGARNLNFPEKEEMLESVVNEGTKYTVKDFPIDSLITLKDGEVWKVVKAGMRASDSRVKSDEITIKPDNKLAKDKNVNLAIDVNLDYLNANVKKIDNK
jgi:hypothetical protein